MGEIIGWEGLCYVPGEGRMDPKAPGRTLVMTTHGSDTKPTPEEAWADAQALGAEYGSKFVAIRPVIGERQERPRRYVTYAVYVTEEATDT